MKIEDQETLNEIFLGKEDPDLAFKKPMTNNLKEDELEYPRLEITPPKLTRDGKDFSIRATANISKYTKDLAKALANKVDEETKKEAKKLGLNILTDKELSTLINQKEKEQEINTMKRVRAWAFNLGDKILAESLNEQIKQLKEELKGGKDE